MGAGRGCGRGLPGLLWPRLKGRDPIAIAVIAAVAALVLDQASKLWLLFVFDIAHRGAVRVTPFFDLVLAWNVGISFGWFRSDSQWVQVLLMLIKAVAVLVLAIWMARSQTLLATLALGLIIGGAIILSLRREEGEDQDKRAPGARTRRRGRLIARQADAGYDDNRPDPSPRPTA